MGANQIRGEVKSRVSKNADAKVATQVQKMRIEWRPVRADQRFSSPRLQWPLFGSYLAREDVSLDGEHG